MPDSVAKRIKDRLERFLCDLINKQPSDGIHLIDDPLFTGNPSKPVRIIVQRFTGAFYEFDTTEAAFQILRCSFSGVVRDSGDTFQVGRAEHTMIIGPATGKPEVYLGHAPKGIMNDPYQTGLKEWLLNKSKDVQKNKY